MNKNLLFFTALSFFSMTFSNDEIVSNDETEVTEVVAAEIVSNDEATVETTEEVAEVAVAEEIASNDEAAFTARTFTLTYTIAPSSDDADFQATARSMNEIIEAGHRGSSTLYQNLFIFIKELQEAVVAGLNLLTSASTSQQNILAVVEEVAMEVAKETMENAMEKIAEAPKSMGINEIAPNSIAIAYTIVAEKAEDVALFESIKAQMMELTEALNARTQTPAELSAMFESIMAQAQALNGSYTTLSANIVNAQE